MRLRQVARWVPFLHLLPFLSSLSLDESHWTQLDTASIVHLNRCSNRSNLVSNSIKFTETGSVRIVTKLLYPRLEPTPAVEIDDPLRLAAVNKEVNAESGTLPKGDLDIEKAGLTVEPTDGGSRRQSKDSGVMRERDESVGKFKAVVRVEVHDTGVGLRKQDIIE